MVHLDVIKTALAKGAEHLGDVVWADVAEVKTDRAQLRAALANAGLPGDGLDDPSEQASLGFAATRYQERGCGVFLRRAKRRAKELLVVRQRGESFEPLATVDVSGGTFAVDRRPAAAYDPDIDRVLASLRADYDAHQHVAHSHEVGALVVRLVLGLCGGIRLKTSGHVYWVPASGARQVRALKSVIDSLGTSHVTILPVHDSQEARSGLQRAATASFDVELQAAAEELESFASSEHATRASTLERRLEDFRVLREKVELYSDILDAQKSGLLDKLTRATARARELIAEIN